MCLPNQEWLLCFSPELFLRIHEEGRLETEPMKGTAPRDTPPECLQKDAKNRAENVMIVDLLRNDLGKLAQTGSVSVPEPFKVSAFGHVWQMTSRIQAQLPIATTLAHILNATFPCGSITGTPKRKSMEIINQLEDTPCEIYTGSIGFLNPQPNTLLGFSGCLNVVIRSLRLKPEVHDVYQACYGVGSGIVYDSHAQSEYKECGWKARFLCQLPAQFALFETMRVQNQTIAWQDEHLQRMAQSAQALNFPFCPRTAQQYIQQTLSTLDQGMYRLKLILHPDGSLRTEQAPLCTTTSSVNIVMAHQALPRYNYLRRHKTTYRAVFDAAIAHAQKQGAFDALLFNTDGILLEGGRSSIVIEYQGQFLTPADELDILPSIARAHFPHTLIPAYITQQMLYNAQNIYIGNALRGWQVAHLHSFMP